MKRALVILSAIVAMSACSSDPADTGDDAQQDAVVDTTQTDDTSQDDIPDVDVQYPERPDGVEDVTLPECLLEDVTHGCAAAPQHDSWACPAGHSPGNANLDVGCITTADTCPSGDYASVPELSNFLYVSSTGSGDGSSQNPLGSISAAIDLARGSGGQVDAILLAKGEYNERVDNDANVRIIGACATETLISYEGLYSVILDGNGQPTLERVTLLGDSWGLVARTSARVEDVVIAGKSDVGIHVDGEDAVLEADGLVVTRTLTTSGTARSIFIPDGGTLIGTNVVVEGGSARGIEVYGASTLELTDSAIVDTQDFGIYVESSAGASVTLNNVKLDNNRGTGLELQGGTALLEDVSITHTQPAASASGFGGEGFFFGMGAVVTGSRVLFSHNHSAGVYANGIDASGHFEDITVTQTQPEGAHDKWGNGLYVMKGAEVHVDRGTFSHNHHIGVAIEGHHTKLFLDEVLIASTQPEEATNHFGVGLWAAGGAYAQITESVVANNHSSGILADGHAVDGTPTTVRVANVIVRDTQADAEDDTLGTGIHIDNGAFMKGSNIISSGNRFAGIWLQGKGEYERTDELSEEVEQVEISSNGEFESVSIVEISPELSSGMRGYGFLVTEGATGSISKGQIERCHTAGVMASIASVESVESELGALASIEALEKDGDTAVTLGKKRLVTQVSLDNMVIRDIYRGFNDLQGDGIQIVGLSKGDFSSLVEELPDFGWPNEIESLADFDWPAEFELSVHASIERSVVENNEGNSVSAYNPLASIEMNESLATGKGQIASVESLEALEKDGATEVTELRGDGLAAMHGAYIRAENSVVEMQGRCGVLVLDSAARGKGSVVQLEGVFVVENSIGINVFSETFDELSAFASVENAENSVEKGSVEIDVDGSSSIESSAMGSMISSIEMAPSHIPQGVVSALGALE